MIVTPVTVDWDVMCSVPIGLTLLALRVIATVVLKDGVENTVKRKAVLVSSIQTVLGVAPVTALLGHVTATQVGLDGDVNSQLALVTQCAVDMGNATPLALPRSVLATRDGWVELARPNVNMVRPRKQPMVLISAGVMDATVE